MQSRQSRARALAAAAALALVTGGGLVGLGAAPAAAHPEVCVTDGHIDHDHEHEHAEICLSQAEIAAMDDSGAELVAGQTAHSDNLRHVANLPKQPGFDAVTEFNSDLAFTGQHAIAGNYNGFSIFDIADPAAPTLVSTTVCPGGQNDVSVAGDLLITSTDSPRDKAGCEDNVSRSEAQKDAWEGIRIFDISDKAHPRYITAVETACGSHTHTTIPDPGHDRTLVYVSSYGPSLAYPDCQPPHDLISIIQIPDGAPQRASVIATPVLFPDGGFPGIPGQTSATTGCHDITAYPAKGLAAGACMGQGVLLDISDPVAPTVIDSVTDPNFAFWHSATFSSDADSVVFTDELGGGGGPTCNPTVGPERGADAVYRITYDDVDADVGPDPRLRFASYFKIPRVNSNTENCVAHNGSLVPVPGRDIMVQGWYQGGISVWEFTDPANPRELAYFDRGPLSDAQLILGGSWSAYWYNGHIYSSDIQQGFDVLAIDEPGFAEAAEHNSMDFFNAQTQTPPPMG